MSGRKILTTSACPRGPILMQIRQQIGQHAHNQATQQDQGHLRMLGP